MQFVGGARSIISNADFSSDQEDTVTSRKNSGGYALIDLGFKINPNASTEILGMVRIKNAFGGFWGTRNPTKTICFPRVRWWARQGLNL